jgi:CheY-like chemotaxis protein
MFGLVVSHFTARSSPQLNARDLPDGIVAEQECAPGNRRPSRLEVPRSHDVRAVRGAVKRQKSEDCSVLAQKIQPLITTASLLSHAFRGFYYYNILRAPALHLSFRKSLFLWLSRMADAAKKILVIEDDREIAGLMVEELTDRGYDVTVAYEGQEGYSAILETAPDLVLCDVMMPVMSGLEILERLATGVPPLRATPFVLLTGMSDRDLELKARRLGADDLITKPIDFDMLHIIIVSRLSGIARSVRWSQLLGMNARQLEMLTWAARGKTSWEIAKILGLSKKTVDFHLDGARIKLGASTRIEAAIKAAIGQLIQP